MVSQRTGLKADLIRAWERRYGAIKPQRTAGRHRFYSDQDIERLLLLRQATSTSRSIGQLAQLTDEQLRSLIEDDGLEPGLAMGKSRARPSSADDTDAVGRQSPSLSPSPETYDASPALGRPGVFDDALQAIAELSSEALSARLDQATLQLGYARALSNWVEPLLAAVRERCRSGRLRGAHLRFAECELRAFVQGLMRRAPLDPAAPRVVIATLIGDRWELGALLMAAHAVGEGWRAVYLGAEVPAEEIAAAQISSEAAAVVLDLPLQQEGSRPDIQRSGGRLADLRRKLGPEIPLLVGGPALGTRVSSLRNPADPDGISLAPSETPSAVIPIQNHGELRTLLLQLRARLRAREPVSENPKASGGTPASPIDEGALTGHRELPLSAEARRRWHLEPSLLTESGSLRIGSLRSVRRLVHRLNENINIKDGEEPLFYAGQIKAAALIHEVLHYGLESLDRRTSGRWTALTDERLKASSTDALAERYADLFPPLSPPASHIPQAAGESPISPKGRLLWRLLVLRWINDNPALQGARRLFDDRSLREDPSYGQVCRALEQELQHLDSSEEESPLFNRLLKAQRSSPDDLPRQLQLFLEPPPKLTADLEDRLWLCLDVLHEERAPRWDEIDRRPLDSEPRRSGPEDLLGPGDISAPLVPVERPDLPWMRELVLATKDVLPWLDQLSAFYGKPISTLDQIPDQELDRLAACGFTGLWLVGIWKRSSASRRIRRKLGDPDAVASAYAIEAYEVADELGGEQGKEDLALRARSRGIRLACDMMPNHTAIDGRWVIEHPERFMQAAERPFPSYTFNGENLSSDPHVAVYLEDHYLDQSDAAVVFQRVDRATGDSRFIYHGNDGNSLPWNDTAQLDFSREDVRQALIDEIVEAAQSFPILRLGAAMTLIRGHFQRLWFPEPGKGGAVPSRAEHQMTREQFSRSMPHELWQEVLREVAERTPETLILAEALWNTEAYFAHELGMHRVDSSAFFELISQGRNAQLIESLKSALTADPSQLECWAHYLIYPGQTQEQPAGDDRYFAHGTLMATLPGCPVFSHFQFEGPRSATGGDPERAPEDPLFREHQRRIAPLLRERRLFARAANLTLFPVHGAEDVIAFANGVEQAVRLVVVNNSPDAKQGVIRHSFDPENYLHGTPGPPSSNAMSQRALTEVLQTAATGPIILVELQGERSWQIDGESLATDGLSLELRPWETRVVKAASTAEAEPDESTE